jgi:hypothetical protein
LWCFPPPPPPAPPYPLFPVTSHSPARAPRAAACSMPRLHVPLSRLVILFPCAGMGPVIDIVGVSTTSTVTVVVNFAAGGVDMGGVYVQPGRPLHARPHHCHCTPPHPGSQLGARCPCPTPIHSPLPPPPTCPTPSHPRFVSTPLMFAVSARSPTRCGPRGTWTLNAAPPAPTRMTPPTSGAIAPLLHTPHTPQGTLEGRKQHGGVWVACVFCTAS